MAVIEVAIGPGRVPGMFRVDVVASPAGEASAAVELDAEALLARRGLLQQAVLASAVSSRRVLPETEQPMREAGEALFAALLGTGEVAGRYRAAAAVAAERGEGLRVVLRIDTPALAGLPWEAMYDRAAGAYVCRQDRLVRHVPVAAVPVPLLVRPPLRILGVVSSPRGLPALDVEKEQDQLGLALARPVSQGLAEVHWALGATWADLQDLLLDGEWHVLHFIGHGDFDPGRDEGVLALEREDGRADLVGAYRMVDLLRQARPMPRLVVLNSCSGAASGVSDLFSGTAAALVRGGVSAVAAMQYEVSDPAAVAFARGFYAAIARGRGADDAVSSGRVAILGLSDRTLEWVTPVLYLRGHDSQLFTLTAPTADAGRPDDRAGNDARRDGQPDGVRGDSSPGQAPSPAQDGPRRLPAAPRPSRPVRILTGHHDGLAVAFSPDGSLLAATEWRTVQLWEVATGAPVRTLAGHDGVVWDVAFSPDGHLLATAGFDPAARLWEVATGAPVRTFAGYEGGATGVAFSPDGTLLATASSQATARLWEVATGAPVRALAGHYFMVSDVAFSPDGTLLATAGDSTARLWEVATGAPVRTLTGHRDAVWRVAFSPDGHLLATVGQDGTARLWEVATGAPVRTLAGHDGVVWDVAFSPDGTLLATAGWDRTARLWEVPAGASAGTLTGHDNTVKGVAFSPDGTLLATRSSDRTVRLWA